MFWQYLIPHHALSRAIGYFAKSEAHWLKNWLIKSFIKRYQVDMRLALEPDPSHYISFNAFFTRALRPDARPMIAGKNTIACPIDGSISQLGMIENGRIFQAKRHHFTTLELLGGSQERAALFEQGRFATLYLSPRDYHRVHMPVTGKLQEMIYVPGQLFSVNPQSCAHIPRLFARNERVISLFQTEFGYMALVLVGAMIVASIETVWAKTVAPAKSKRIQVWRYTGQDLNICLEKGAEMGRFKLGSTVIVLFSSSAVQWDPGLNANDAVVLGGKLGSVLEPV